MDLIRWTPLKDIDDLFDRYRKGYFPVGLHGIESGSWRPAADIVESEKEYVIKADLPEVKKDDIELKLDQGVLTISGERRDERSTDDAKLHRRETFYGSFTRSFAMPDDVDETGIKAEAKDGVLRVILPKTSPSKKSPVSIKVG
jgi:HSP20 family protein